MTAHVNNGFIKQQACHLRLLETSTSSLVLITSYSLFSNDLQRPPTLPTNHRSAHLLLKTWTIHTALFFPLQVLLCCGHLLTTLRESWIQSRGWGLNAARGASHQEPLWLMENMAAVKQITLQCWLSKAQSPVSNLVPFDRKKEVSVQCLSVVVGALPPLTMLPLRGGVQTSTLRWC